MTKVCRELAEIDSDSTIEMEWLWKQWFIVCDSKPQ